MRVAPSTFDAFEQMSGGQFVLKCAAACIKKNDGRVRVTKFGKSCWMAHAVPIERCIDYKMRCQNISLQSASRQKYRL